MLENQWKTELMQFKENVQNIKRSKEKKQKGNQDYVARANFFN